MNKNIVPKIGNFIADNKKPLLYIGGAIAVVVIAYTIVNKITKGVGDAFKDKSKGATPFTKVAVDEKKSTISNSEANNFANQLWNAMKDSGTDEGVITAVLEKIQKKDDFRKVYNAFGKKSYYLTGEPTISAYLFDFSDYDLIEWFNAEVGYSNLPTYLLIKKTVTNAGFAF